MTAEITNTNWFLNKENYEGTVTFRGKKGGLINVFSYGTEFKVGKKTKLELDSISAKLDWDTIFSKNQDKELKLIQKSDWEYEGYGKILDINPIVIDFGEFELNTGNWTNDQKIIGEFVYWEIERLDIYSQ